MTCSMTCEAFEGLLPRYLEDEASTAEGQALELHATGCDECGALLAGIREVTAEAAVLPALVPARDLWEGIAARIEAPALTLDSRRPAAARGDSGRAGSWDQRWLAAAAAALVIGTAGTTHLVTRQMMASGAGRVAVVDVAPEPGSFTEGQAGIPDRGSLPLVGQPDGASPGSLNAPGAASSRGIRGPSPVAQGSVPQGSLPQGSVPQGSLPQGSLPQGSVPQGSLPQGSLPQGSLPGASDPRQALPAAASGSATLVSASTAVEEVYDAEIAQLQDVLDRRRNELDPATTVVLENNLRIIDRAIRDSRWALARDPASGFLTDQLAMALDKKLQLMRTAARLPSRT